MCFVPGLKVCLSTHYVLTFSQRDGWNMLTPWLWTLFQILKHGTFLMQSVIALYCHGWKGSSQEDQRSREHLLLGRNARNKHVRIVGKMDTIKKDSRNPQVCPAQANHQKKHVVVAFARNKDIIDWSAQINHQSPFWMTQTKKQSFIRFRNQIWKVRNFRCIGWLC